jgi:hypothetical protein
MAKFRARREAHSPGSMATDPGVLLRVLRVCYAPQEMVMSYFIKDFEYFGPKAPISSNVYGHVTGTKVKNHQCLRALLRVLRVYTPKVGGRSQGGLGSRLNGIISLG